MFVSVTVVDCGCVSMCDIVLLNTNYEDNKLFVLYLYPVSVGMSVCMCVCGLQHPDKNVKF